MGQPYSETPTLGTVHPDPRAAIRLASFIGIFVLMALWELLARGGC